MSTLRTYMGHNPFDVSKPDPVAATSYIGLIATMHKPHELEPTAERPRVVLEIEFPDTRVRTDLTGITRVLEEIADMLLDRQIPQEDT